MEMRRLVLSCVALALAGSIMAQNKSVTLSLEKALEVALNENPTIKIANMEIDRQEYAKKETLGNLLPALSAGADYNYNIKRATMDFGGTKFSFEPENTLTGSATISLPLYMPALYRTLKLNDEQMRAAVETARASKLTLVNEVKKAYYNILMAQESLIVLKASESTIQQTVDLSSNMFKNGLSSEYDLLTAQVQLSNLKPSIIQSESMIKVGKQMLKMLTGLPQEIDVEVEGTLGQWEKNVEEMTRFLSSDYQDNSDLKSLGIQKDILTRQLSVLKTQRMPTLAAFTNYSAIGRDKVKLPSPGAPPSSPEWENQQSWRAGASLSVPIFAGWAKTNKEKQVKVAISQLETQHAYLERAVDVQVKNSLTNLEVVRQQMYSNALTVKQAEKAFQISKSRYEAGAGTILELNSAELIVTQSKMGYAQSIYNFLSAHADYEKLVGKESEVK